MPFATVKRDRVRRTERGRRKQCIWMGGVCFSTFGSTCTLLLRLMSSCCDVAITDALSLEERYGSAGEYFMSSIFSHTCSGSHRSSAASLLGVKFTCNSVCVCAHVLGVTTRTSCIDVCQHHLNIA